MAGGAANGNGTVGADRRGRHPDRGPQRLAGLGYGADEIRLALARLPAEGTVEDQLRLALREMAAAR